MNRLQAIFRFRCGWALAAAILSSIFAGAVSAADFDLSRPAIELRRLQYCGGCREPLVVTTIAPGAAVRCPKCKTVARRLPDRELLVKVYQVCSSCAARLDVAAMPADAPLRCGACGLAQRVMPEAVHGARTPSGSGEIPPGPAVTPAGNPPPAAPRRLPVPRVPGLNAEAAPSPQPEIKIEEGRGSDEAEKNTAVNMAAKPGAAYAAPLADPAETLKISVLVNGEPVSTAEVQQTVNRNLQMLRLRGGAAPSIEELTALRQKITAELIEREILRQAARQSGFVPAEDAVQARLAQAPNTLTRAGVRAEMILEEMKKRHTAPAAAVSEAAVARYYREHEADFVSRPRLRLRALTIFKNRTGRSDRRPAEIIAAEVKEKLDFGIKFTAVAARYSEDVFRTEGGLMRGSTGGELIAVDDLAEPLHVVFARPRPGEIFGPLQLLTGYAFCQVEQVEPAAPVSLETARERIRGILQKQAREAAFCTWLDGLKKAAVIEYQ